MIRGRPQRITPSRISVSSVLGTTLVTLILAALFVLVIFVYALNIPLGLRGVSLISTLAVIVTLLAGYYLSDRNVWSFSFIYLAVLGVFHFGIVVPYGLYLITVGDIPQGHIWWTRETTSFAILLATLGFLACGIGIGIGRLLVNRMPPVVPGNHSLPSERKTLTIVGSALLIGSVVVWFLVTILSSGISVLVGSYRNYLDSTAGIGVYSYIWLTLGLGLCFVVISPKSRLKYLAVLAFVLFAVVALPLGLRGEVMFSSAAAAALLARHRRMPSALSVLIGALVLLIAISFFRELRAVGISGLVSGSLNVGPVRGLAELGVSLRPLTEVVDWRAQGEDYLYGASYWAPFERMLCSVVTPSACVEASRDHRLMNVLMMERVGPWGFSPMAEAFRNFGAFGVVAIMGGLGVLVSVLNRWTNSWIREAIAAVVFVELLINVRNAFTAVPAHLVLGAIIVIAMVILSEVGWEWQFHRRGRSRRRQRRGKSLVRKQKTLGDTSSSAEEMMSKKV
jgi:hypothetical protein